MNRIRGSVVSVATLALLVGAFAPACNHTDSSLFIDNVQAPPANVATASGTCAYTAADPTAPAEFSGVFDVAVVDTFTAVLLVGNQLNEQADPQSDRTETSRITVTLASVNVTTVASDGSSAALGDPFTVQVESFVNPGGGGVTGYGLVQVTLIDDAVTAILRKDLTTTTARKSVAATVKLYGQTLGEQQVVSNSFTYPIEVCNGCSITGLVPAVDLTPSVPLPGLVCQSAMGETFSCAFGQDGNTPCDHCDKPDCHPCPSNCTTCSTSEVCTKCDAGYNLVSVASAIASEPSGAMGCVKQ